MIDGPIANTHRETSLNDTSKAIDSWTDKFSVPVSESHTQKKKLTEQRLTVVEICDSYSHNLTNQMPQNKGKHSLKVLANPNPMFSKSPK